MRWRRNLQSRWRGVEVTQDKELLSQKSVASIHIPMLDPVRIPGNRAGLAVISSSPVSHPYLLSATPALRVAARRGFRHGE